MSKRSTRLAKRDEFENAIKAVEEGIRSRRGKGAERATPEQTGRTEEQDRGEIDKEEIRK